MIAPRPPQACSPCPRNLMLYRFLQGVPSGLMVGGFVGTAACCGGNALFGALTVWTDWNQFAHPCGAMLVSALYLGCLGFPVGAIIAIPSGLLLGGLLRCRQLPKHQIWFFAGICIVTLFGLVEVINLFPFGRQPTAAIIPGRWIHHLLTLLGVGGGLVWWHWNRDNQAG